MFFFLGVFFNVTFFNAKKSHNFGRKAGELSSIQHFGGGPLVSLPQICCPFCLFFVSEKTPSGYIWRLSASLTDLTGPKSDLEKT